MVGFFTYAAVIGLPMVEATNLASFNKIVRLGKLLKLSTREFDNIQQPLLQHFTIKV